MGMFDSYETLNNNYVPQNKKPIPPCSPENSVFEPLRPRKPYEEINAKGELIGYYWYYGDTVNLDFTIEGDIYGSVESFLQDKVIRIELYNFRGELITFKTFEGSTNVIFPIDEELSKKLVKGTYTCSLSVLNSLTGMNKTLIHQEDCTLIVK